ncbi:MAG TPA: cellulose synthase operon protein YhjQ/BcsQ [Terracidiphilus sp.]|jgi:cellulose synthase operon protein YhjQ|nr:cellulose synthase operon protein YhjQ/BcsQ [Terracidiphilus sp.]
MTDRIAVSDPNETPEDVATLYSWANLYGAKYRDYSVSRAQTRERVHQRVQEAIKAERQRARHALNPEDLRAAEALRAMEAEREALTLARENAEKAEREATERVAQLAALQAARQQPAAPRPPANPAHPANPPYQAVHPAPPAPRPPAYAQHLAAPGFPLEPARFESSAGRASEWRETGLRPAWLATERGERGAPPLEHAPGDTLQGSRDRIASRWFALKGLSSTAPAQPDSMPAQSASRAPVLAVFSLAGGVGKTSLVATLGRALSARGERVLLVDTAVYGLLPFFFGARDQRPGVLRTFTPPGNGGDAPIQMLTLDTENLETENAQDGLAQEVMRNSRNASRVIVDVATASGATTRRVLRLAPTVLVPLIPDLSSVVSVGSIEGFFQRNFSAAGQAILPFYILNQFDSSLPLHLDIREVLREPLGERLLPFSLRRAPAVSEALAEGMTVMDYAPNSTVTEDFGALAGWVKSFAAPASLGFRGVRWSER